MSLVTDEETIPAVQSEITVKLDSLLNRPFLYGSTLQESSVYETPGEDPVDIPAINLGLYPAKFEVFANKLRLVTDSSFEFESDINRPSRLIHEFDIVKKNKDSITFLATAASPILHTFFLGKDSKLSVRASWLRSFAFAKEDQLFLFESSAELSDGSVAAFFETITPRERIVPAGSTAIYADEDLNPDSTRFRFLDAGVQFVEVERERVPTKAAQRFLLKNDQPIRWWVTNNVPEEYLNDVKNGVEAWNRYAKNLGKKKLVEFMGKLPAHIKIGDPRYNIIVWDNIQEADSAYESQSSDPITGIQSHSLIYLPLAWVNIGNDYWENVGTTKPPKENMKSFLSKRTIFGRKAPVHCFHSAAKQASLTSLDDEENFGRRLLKTVVFHEMGHALGLAHNFKGSLSFDLDSANPIFSTSIMDYNQYNEEDFAFPSLESSDGPLLEYDRQILSFLYNEGKSILPTDPVLPACADDEADSLENGVDPLCIRYDIGNDPTKTAERTLALLTTPEARKGNMQALPKTLARLHLQLGSPDDVIAADKLSERLTKLKERIAGVVGIYLSNDVNSFGIALSDAMLSLYLERDLPPNYNISEMRDRTLTVIEAFEAMPELPAATQVGYQALKANLENWLLATPMLKNMGAEERDAKLREVFSAFDSHWKLIQEKNLLKVRTRIAGAIQYSKDAPFSFHQRNGNVQDLESYVIQKLEQFAVSTTGSWKNRLELRTKSVQALTKFPLPSKSGSLQKIREVIEGEIQLTRDVRERQALRNLLDALK